MTKLADLNARFLDAGGEGITRNGQPVPHRRGVGVLMDCPCGCDDLLAVDFNVALDGKPWRDEKSTWRRTGDTLETLTLHPSVQRVGGCAWHGWIRNGEAVTA